MNSLRPPARLFALGVAGIATLAAPWGHGFCLVEFVGRGYDAVA